MKDTMPNQFPSKRNFKTSLSVAGFALPLVIGLSLILGWALPVNAQSAFQSQVQTPPNNTAGQQAVLNQQTAQATQPQTGSQTKQIGSQTKPTGSQTKQPGPAQPAQLKTQPQAIQTGVANPKAKPALSQFDQVAAFQYLTDICAIGPRVSASNGMLKQQKLLDNHFKKLKCKRFTQAFQVRSPYNNRFVQLKNIIIQFHPERKKRLLICCHHDTRPLPDQDPVNPRGRFIGANDGASGVALLMELGKHLEKLDGQFGIDFIFFDGEEFVIQRRGQMFMGSTYFSQEYQAGKVPWKYEYGILVDMVADKDLQIFYEGNSLGLANGLTRSVWTVAKDLGVKEFVPKERHKIRDDHLPLNSIAGIRTVDIIDFDYPNPAQGNIFWHTTKDVPANCSADSLGKVGKVVLGWIREMQRLNPAQQKKGN